MKSRLQRIGFVVCMCFAVSTSKASTGPLAFSTEATLGGGYFAETFTLTNLQSSTSPGNVLKVRFDFPVAATVLSVPSGWNAISAGTSIEVFSGFPGPPPLGTDLAPGGSVGGFKFLVGQSLGPIPVSFLLITPQLTQVVTMGTSTVSTVFSQFTGKLEIARGVVNPDFELNAQFSLGQKSNGINPSAEPVILQIGPLWITLPAGAFTSQQNVGFAFEGTISGVSLEARFQPVGNNVFTLTVEGTSNKLTGLSGVLPLTLSIGDDAGVTTTSADN